MHNTLKIGKWYIGISLLRMDGFGLFFENKQEAFRIQEDRKEEYCFYYDGCNNIQDQFAIDADWTEKHKEEEQIVKIRIYEKAPKEYILAVGIIGSKTPLYAIEITNDWSYCRLRYDMTRTNGGEAFESLVLPFSYAMIKHNAVVFHGVLMEYKGIGIVLTAPSGTGKSTHAHLWREYENALIINGDRALLQREEDQVIGYGIPWCGSSGEYVNRNVPVAVIVVLEQAQENTVRQLDPVETYLDMVEAICAPRWEPELFEQGVNLAEQILEVVPVLKLSCRPDQEAVNVLKKEVNRIIEEKNCLL